VFGWGAVGVTVELAMARWVCFLSAPCMAYREKTCIVVFASEATEATPVVAIPRSYADQSTSYVVLSDTLVTSALHRP
jgi:hypothetical protein